MPSVTGQEVGANGLGLMNLTWRPTVTPDEIAFKVMKSALDNGANFWNTADFYGRPPNQTANLQLLNRYFTKYPEDSEKVVLFAKGGVEMGPGGPRLRGDREGIQRSVDNTLRILDGKVKLGIFECARVDTSVPLEETISTLAEYVRAGKIGGIGLSEAGPKTIRKAHSIHPIAAVEVEVSLWATEIFTPGGVADTCAELGIPIVAYCPLGAGFLTGAIKSPDDIPEGDGRRHFDRFQPGNFEKNLVLVDKVSEISKRKGCTNAQLALAWVRQVGNAPGKAVIIPIPGATTVERAEENFKACVELTAGEMEEISKILRSMEIAGARYSKALSSLLLVDHE